MKYSTEDIAEITNSKLIGEKNLVVKNIEFDSRNIYTSKIMHLLPLTLIKILVKNTYTLL